MVRKLSRRTVVAAGGLIVAGAGGAFVAAREGTNDNPSNDEWEFELEWGGQGSEHAELDCEENELGYWKWILTPPPADPPGPPTPITEAELTVEFEDGTTVTADGYRPGVGGRGAMHFDVYKETGGTVVQTENTVVRYNGGGEGAILTISESECVEEKLPEPEPPDVKTKPATDVNKSTATLNGYLTDLGDYEEVYVFFEWREKIEDNNDNDDNNDNNDEPPWNATEFQLMTETGAFSAEIEGLEVGGQYEFRAVVTAQEIFWPGNIKQFEKPEPEDPDVKTKPATEVNDYTAMLNGYLTDLGDYRAVYVHFEWRPKVDDNDDNNDNYDNDDGWHETEPQRMTETGPFSAEIEGLERGTHYEFRAVVTANEQRWYGDIEQFEKEEVDEKKQPDPRNDLSLEVDCYEKREKGIEVRCIAYNDYDKSDVKCSWTANENSDGGKVTIPANGKEYFYPVVKDKYDLIRLYFDGDVVGEVTAKDADPCEGY